MCIRDMITSFINAKLLEPITRLSKAMKEVSQGDFEQHLETNSRIAVSYTHLDVYKRQACHKLEYVEYLNDLLLMSDQEERADTVKELLTEDVYKRQVR